MDTKTLRAGDIKKGMRFSHYFVLVEATSDARQTHKGFVRVALKPVNPADRLVDTCLNVHASATVVVL